MLATRVAILGELDEQLCLLENDQDEGAGALVRAGGAQVLVIRQIAWMAVCVPGRASVPACQRASVPGARVHLIGR